ncbi:hypothetical protein G6F62_002640 [Rhizopus arrhizus]|nr:hypothetical protein G6F24_006690 [Rhizopus arrhizus]KAG0794115.1 hypothetical protein G6F21_003110 [Rhizopus arrhizus]KAG0815332.1 hypothetical protein G6F20_004073 [Rhizopus arrhizus]KAG0836480.1 hypothetical protein G6F19_004213 [Rhizopus arrhizus]KAG0839315.1 hypothetical protein G6F18_004163 [Rhizopus arrhizus]
MVYNDWSDDDTMTTKGRDKFRHERSYDDYDRRKRSRRSPTPPEERRRKRRPSPRRGRDMEIDQDAAFGAFPMMDMMNPQMMGTTAWTRFPVDPNQLDYLVPYKQFSEYHRRTAGRRIDDEDIQKRYAHYKEKFASRQLSQFFSANKDKQWFLEKYHPVQSRARYEDMIQRRKRYLKDFLMSLENGELDDIRLDKTTEDVVEAKKEEEDENEEYEPRLVIKTVPPTIAREKILEMYSKVDGFDYLSLSEPQPNRKFQRIGWICFKPGTDIKHVFNQLDNQKVDDFVFHLALNRKSNLQNRTPRVAPEITQSVDRLTKDLEQIRELALALEAMLSDDLEESGMKAVENRAKKVIADHEEESETFKLKKRLDMLITYLRRVHMYCYYCAMECDSLEELNRKCCEPHCRSTVEENNNDSKQGARNEKGAMIWAKNLDQKISMKIHTPDERELKKLGGKVAQAEVDEFVQEHVLKEHESKFKCQVGECSKAFKGYDYVEKHILTKHPDEIERKRAEVDYFNNYVCDPNHLLPSQQTMPNMAQPPPFIMRPPAISWEQIPRLGIDMSWNSRRPRPDESLPKDPRQVKSYVDLDAPAEGDSNISFY